MNKIIFYKFIYVLRSFFYMLKYFEFLKYNFNKRDFNSKASLTKSELKKLNVDYVVNEKNTFINIILLSTHQDIKALLENRKILEKFIQSGGKLISNEHMPFFPGFFSKQFSIIYTADFNKILSKYYSGKVIYSPRSETMINLERFSDRNIKKEIDVLIVTWFNDTIHKGWNTTISFLEEALKKGISITIIDYHGGKMPSKLSLLSDKYPLLSILPSQNKNNFAKIINSAKLGFFPNIMDASPRILSQFLASNVPIILNKNIYGGQHLISKETGLFFERNEEIIPLIEYILKNQHLYKKVRENYIKSEGMFKKNKLLKKSINGYFGLKCEKVFFSNDSYLLKKNLKYKNG